MNGPRGWYNGLRYSLKPGDHKGRHLSRREKAWAARQDDDWADELRGMNQELADEFAPAVCAPGCQGEEHRTALLPLPAWDSPGWHGEGRDKYYIFRDELAAVERGEVEDLGDFSQYVDEPARPRRRRRPWFGLFGGPDPQNLPGPVVGSGVASRAGEPILTGEIVDAPPADQPPVVISVSITVSVHPTPALKADLARIDADTLAFLARIDAAFAEQRHALHAWSEQLELTAGAA